MTSKTEAKGRVVTGVGGVIVHAEDGSFTYLKGETVPANHAELISNEAVWATEEAEEAESVEAPDPAA